MGDCDNTLLPIGDPSPVIPCRMSPSEEEVPMENHLVPAPSVTGLKCEDILLKSDMLDVVLLFFLSAVVC